MENPIVESEVLLITQLVRSTEQGKLECSHTLSTAAVPYAKEIAEIIEKKHNANVDVYGSEMVINWYHD